MNRRDALKILAAAPAAVLAAPILAGSRSGKSSTVPAEAVKVWPTPRRSQNLSMAELNDAFLYKWIPKGPARRGY